MSGVSVFGSGMVSTTKGDEGEDLESEYLSLVLESW